MPILQIKNFIELLPLQDTKKCYWNPQEKFKIDMPIQPYLNLQSVQDKRRNALSF